MDTIQETLETGLQVPPHILLMEDELSVAKGLETILTEEGYDVDLAMTGRSALDKFGDNVFDLLVADLRLPGDADKPVVIGEFHFGALDRGKFHASLRQVPDQEARGAAYEKYVRSALENPLIVGTHWHQYGDQATTGRDDGENFQNGFIDVCDTPYTETIEACRRIGNRLYEVRAGQ